MRKHFTVQKLNRSMRRIDAFYHLFLDPVVGVSDAYGNEL